MIARLALLQRWVAAARGRLVIAGVILVGLYFVVAFGEQAWKARSLQAEVAERQAVIDQMEARQDELKQQIQDYSTDDYLAYVERSARRDLNLSRPGETVLLVRWLDAPAATPTATATPASGSTPEANWQRWVHFFKGD